ncbi:hypothetical protein LV82_01108 [Albidovulum inexpectatum]|uniref:Uncharacterized protein n=1 Tax=Albidovulum inexpectatum TaxID=196587 RepID=A0A2S5JI07_9RHOB|nr:hypothetical protein [Albidovulum inexpectatum]PPB81069.1 hypothetical protein LV82_01108 [Albidovulum inexpectatum]
MTGLRPEVIEFLTRWRELIAAVAAALVGIWVWSWGGWFWQGLGVVVVLAAAGWARVAWSRARLAGIARAPGIVQVTEGQISFFGPHRGGFIALADLREVRLSQENGHRVWCLISTEREALTIPVAAEGADKLYDLLAALPGMDIGAVSAAISGPIPPGALWTRPGSRALFRGGADLLRMGAQNRDPGRA